MEENKELNPNDPKEAVLIIDYLTKDLNIGTRSQSQVFNMALQTLFNAVNQSDDGVKHD